MKNIRASFEEKYKQDWTSLKQKYKQLDLSSDAVNIYSGSHHCYITMKNIYNNNSSSVFKISEDRANFATEAEALHNRVEADAKFMEELEQLPPIKGLPESSLTIMLRELKEMLGEFPVSEKSSGKCSLK